MKPFYTFILGLVLGCLLCFAVLEGNKILETRIHRISPLDTLPIVDTSVVVIDTLGVDSLQIDSVLLEAAEKERTKPKRTARKKDSQNFNPRDRGYASDYELQFTLQEDVVRNILVIEGKNFSDDLTTALILDSDENIMAWYNSNQLRVRNKRIELNIQNINPGKYTIRIVADGAKFSRAFTKI